MLHTGHMVLICLLHLLVVIHAGLQFILLDRGQLPTCCGCTLLNGLNARLILGHAGFKCLRLAGHGVDSDGPSVDWVPWCHVHCGPMMNRKWRYWRGFWVVLPQLKSSRWLWHGHFPEPRSRSTPDQPPLLPTRAPAREASVPAQVR